MWYKDINEDLITYTAVSVVTQKENMMDLVKRGKNESSDTRNYFYPIPSNRRFNLAYNWTLYRYPLLGCVRNNNYNWNNGGRSCQTSKSKKILGTLK